MRFRWLAALGILALVGYLLGEWHRHSRYNGERERIRQLVVSLRDRRPEVVSSEAWEAGIGWTMTAHLNVCFSPRLVSREALFQLGRQLDERLASGIDAGTIEWVWDRLAETGPHGKQYIDRFRPVMQEAMGTKVLDQTVAK